MRTLPDEFDGGALTGLLADGWRFDAESVEYAPVGFGSYHWVVTGTDGTRGFVTVDDLDRSPWLGDTRDAVFDGLRRAFQTSASLRDGGLRFVVAPILTRLGEALRRAGPRHTVALFPFVEGETGQSGQHDPADRAAVVAMLADLHRATPATGSVARRIDVELPGRRGLDAALQDLDRTWSAGPFSERARQALDRHSNDVAELLALFDRLSVEVAKRSTDWVVTHGEPHARNVMLTGEGRVLVDWDTVALAPPERDLWMLVEDAADDEATVYADATGRRVDQVALDFFRLMWDLSDLAAFTDVLRSPHRHSEDTVKTFDGLTSCVAIRDQWAAQLD